jgi:hypothetical protein
VDPYADDPFFKRVSDANWNACIGKQGHEENYLDGYIEAAMELAAAVIDKRMFAKRDTLVLPILYNARHAVELALKFTTDRFVAADLMPRGRRDHNIQAHWNRLHAASPGDEQLLTIIDALKPFVDSLSRIDNDGQELRYHTNQSDDRSLADYSLANLQIIRDSLAELSDLISALKYRTMDFLEERTTGTFTNRCSRRDLLVIARSVPRRDLWKTPEFDQHKAIIKARFNLGNRQFSKALDMIQNNREMKAILGIESSLLHTSDDDVISAVTRWRRLHPVKEASSDHLGIDLFDASRLEVMIDRLTTLNEISAELQTTLTPDKLAEIEAMFYIARDRVFPEFYERLVLEIKKEHTSANDARTRIEHLMEKTNFCECLRLSAEKLGRLSLAERLAHL